jgi:hypothetical protein
MKRSALSFGVFGVLASFAACGFKEVEPGLGGEGGANGSSVTVVGSTGTAPTLGEPGILCGDSSCAVPDEACCAGLLQCIPADGVCVCGTECDSSDEISLRCDDAVDCDAGEGCCAGELEYECRTLPCAIEVCVDGGACSGQRRCVLGGGSATGHVCVEPGVVGCGAADCSGATPACCWDNLAQTGSCGADGPGACEGLVLTCASPSDCNAGESCCVVAEGASCKSACGGVETPLCDLDSECAAGTTCVQLPGYPVGARSCQ